jgi:Telomere capping, CST complex subunit
VRHHDSASGTIYLTHEYPRLPYQIIARVDTSHVLEAMEHIDCQVGAWLNITGYTFGRMMNPQYSIDIGSTPVYSEVSIRAVMLWNAGSLDLGLYERALVARKSNGTTS